MECWPRFADPEVAGAESQYPGWPRTIEMTDNYNRKAFGYLPTLKINGLENPVVQVISETDNEVVYTLRLKNNVFQPRVFNPGTYTVLIKDMEGKEVKRFSELNLLKTGEEGEIAIDI